MTDDDSATHRGWRHGAPRASRFPHPVTASPALSALLAIMAAIPTMGLALADSPTPTPPEPPCRRVVLAHPPAAFFSAAWAPGEREILVADIRNDRVLRYLRDGAFAGDVSFAAVSGVRHPKVFASGDSTLVITGSTRLLALESPNLTPRVIADFEGATFPDGATFVGFRFAQPRRDIIVANAIVRRANREGVAGLLSLTTGPQRDWKAIIPVPQTSALGGLVHSYPQVLALVGDRLFALEYGEPSRVHELAPEKRTLVSFPPGFGMLPPFPVDLVAEAAALRWAANVQATPIPVGLYAQGGFLYLATREPANQGATTWRLHRIDPVSDRLLGSLVLPTAAADLLILPGEQQWALIEKGPYKAGFVHDTLGMVLIPAATIQAPWSATAQALPPCTPSSGAP